MFTCGQKVVYGIHGVCVIIDREIRSINRKKVEYYVLAPTTQPSARFYVPTQNEIAVAKLRPLLSREDLDDLISSSETIKDIWIPDENRRKQRYHELINGSDRAALIAMVKSLLVHKEQQLSSGRKFHLCDENFLRDAQKLLSAEFAMVLGIEQEQVGNYIQERINNKSAV